VQKSGDHKVVSAENSPAEQFAYTPAGSQTWDLSQSFAEHPEENPLPDQFNNPDVWSWMFGEPARPNSYVLMETLLSPQTTEENCGEHVKRFYQWVGGHGTGVAYNAGPTVERGQDECAPFAEYPTKTVPLWLMAGSLPLGNQQTVRRSLEIIHNWHGDRNWFGSAHRRGDRWNDLAAGSGLHGNRSLA
jgi:hypothetical protein